MVYIVPDQPIYIMRPFQRKKKKDRVIPLKYVLYAELTAYNSGSDDTRKPTKNTIVKF